MNHRYIALLLIVLAGIAGMVHADDNVSYLLGDDVPNPVAYMPLPPDTASVVFHGDYARWIWGKSMRNTPRGEQASWESRYGAVRLSTIYSDVLGIDISAETTPAIYHFMSCAGTTGASAVVKMKETYFRRRPFLVMGEDVWGQFDSFSELENNSSYPSSHTSYGWGAALALAQMAPCMQDTILRRGYEYGISRVIVGAHWQSDVDAAMLCASAAIARARGNEQYKLDLLAAQEEFMQLKGITREQLNGGYPVMGKILDAPPSISDYWSIGDVDQYWAGKQLRDGERGETATADISLTDEYLIEMFNECSQITISSTETPNIANLISTLKFILNKEATELKKQIFRRRPYVQFKEHFKYGDYEWNISMGTSYPSRHAFVGWGIALALTEVMTADQDAVLKRGREYGESTMIKGHSYASDVQAARVMAACLIGYLHDKQLILTLLDYAKSEYQQKLEDAAIETVMAQSIANPAAWYSINGVEYQEKPEIPGIYIHNGEKVVISK